MIIYFKILLMCLTLYVIRVIPFILLKNEIKNKYVKSFLNYVPYVTLSVMTFPAIITATKNDISGIAAFVVGLLTAWYGGNIFTVSISCCITVLLIDYLFLL